MTATQLSVEIPAAGPSRAIDPHDWLSGIAAPQSVDLEDDSDEVKVAVSELLGSVREDSDEGMVEGAALFAAALPRRLRRELISFRRQGDPSGALLLRGLPVEVNEPTPANAFDGSAPAQARAIQALIAAVLGEQVGYFEESSGGLFQHIVPTRKAQMEQSSGSSATALDLHTETAFHDHLPDYVILQCLRPDAEKMARTTLVSVARLVPALSAAVLCDLLRPEFRTKIDVSFGGGDRESLLAVLHGHPLTPYLRYDADLMSGATDRAQRALDEILKVARALQWPLELEAGDMLIVNNRLAVHGRTQFRAYFDGKDRWLLRSFVVGSLGPSAAHRLPASRIIHVDPVMKIVA